MDDLIASIQAAFAEGATTEARTVGASACRTLLAALAPQVVTPEIAAVAPQIAAAVRGMNFDQLLELAIAKLRALEAQRPRVTTSEAPRGISILRVPIPPHVAGPR